MATLKIELAPGPEGQEEATFVGALLAEPSDEITRRVFADWLEDRGHRLRAKYLREIRTRKFVRFVKERGWYAFYQEPPMAPRVKWNDPLHHEPPSGHSPCVALSDRCKDWIDRFARGWVMPRWVCGHGWSMKCDYFGVYTWEYLRIIAPQLDLMGE